LELMDGGVFAINYLWWGDCNGIYVTVLRSCAIETRAILQVCTVLKVAYVTHGP
jgi:hypothetical protein